MKRMAVGALFLSLAAGSLAMAGQGYRPELAGGYDRNSSHTQSRPDHGGEHRNDRRDNDHRGNGNRNGWRNDRHNDGRRFDHDRRNDWNRDHGRSDHWRNDQWRHDDGRRDDRWRNDQRRFDHNSPRYNYRPGFRNDWGRPRYSFGVYHRPSGYYDHRWSRGDRLPRAFYARPYVIADYDRCGLRSPPYGYHWVRVDNDAVLAFIATGVVLDVIYNQFY